MHMNYQLTTVQAVYSTPLILFANRHNKNKLDRTRPHRRLPFVRHLEYTALVEWNCPFENYNWRQSRLCSDEREHEITTKRVH